MAESPTKLTRRGFPIYKHNPSITSNLPMRIKPKKQHRLANAYMITPGTDEHIMQGAFTFVEEQIVDTEEFVKVFLAGQKKQAELSKAGLTLLAFVHKQISGRDAADKDTVLLNPILAQEHNPPISERTYFRGMNELLEKNFLFRSIAADMYFVNINFMFNGNRINVLKSYIRKGTEAEQQELPLVTLPQLIKQAE